MYLVGSTPLPEPFDLKNAGLTLGYPADRVDLVSREAGFFSVEDAWHFLATQGGCGRIDLLVAEPRDREGLRPLSPAVRLCG